MAILVGFRQAISALQTLIDQGNALLPTPDPVQYQAWKMLVLSSIGMIYGTGPETREIEDGFLLGENSPPPPPPPPPNRVEAVNRVLEILERYLSTLRSLGEMFPPPNK